MPYSYSNAERAQILVEALPYIKKHSGKIVVIKYGGNAMINETLKQQVMEDIVLLWHTAGHGRHCAVVARRRKNRAGARGRA